MTEASRSLRMLLSERSGVGLLALVVAYDAYTLYKTA